MKLNNLDDKDATLDGENAGLYIANAKTNVETAKTDDETAKTDDETTENYESQFKKKYKTDPSTGICVASHGNFKAMKDKNAPAWLIVKDPSRASETFTVKGADGKDYCLTASWIAGFVDGEGTLTFYLNKNSTTTLGFQIQAAFIIVQGEADYFLLTAIANFLGCGSVTVNRADKTSVRYQYRLVDSTLLSELLIPFFENVPLCTKKGDEFKTWAKLVLLLLLLNKNRANGYEVNGWIELLEELKQLKFQGFKTKQSLSFVKTCDKYIDHVKKLNAKRSQL